MPKEFGYCITKVVIPASEAYSTACWAASTWAGYFINSAIEDASYNLDELPDDAVRFADLWTYFGEQGNGGHAQYRGYTVGDTACWRRAAALLEKMELFEHHAVFEDFVRFSIENEARLEELYAKGEGAAARRLFWPLDDRFAVLKPASDDLQIFLRDWLLCQPWVEIDHCNMPATMDRLGQYIPLHPMAKQRRAARLRRSHAENHGTMMALMRRFIDRQHKTPPN